MIGTMIARKTNLDTLAVSLLLGCCLFWGLQQVLIKATLAEIPPMFQASLRLWGATALLWLWCMARGVPLCSPAGPALQRRLGPREARGSPSSAATACTRAGPSWAWPTTAQEWPTPYTPPSRGARRWILDSTLAQPKPLVWTWHTPLVQLRVPATALHRH